MLSLCCHVPVSMNSETASTQQHRGLQQGWTKAWELRSAAAELVFSAPEISHSILSQKGESKHTLTEQRSHKSPHAWNHRINATAGSSKSLFFMLSPWAHTHPYDYEGSQGNPSWGVGSLCCCVPPVMMCHGAGISARKCHLPLAQEGNETRFYWGLSASDGDGSHYTQGKRYIWDTNHSVVAAFFECCTCFQKTDLSVALS